MKGRYLRGRAHRKIYGVKESMQKHSSRQTALKNIWQKAYNGFFRFLMFWGFYFFRGQSGFKVKNELL